MVVRQGIQFVVQVNARGFNPNPFAGCIQNFHIHMNLCDGNRERGTVINRSVFAKKDDLAGRGCFHER